MYSNKTQRKQGFDIGKAIATRKNNALKTAGVTREDITQNLVSKSFGIISERIAELNVTTQLEFLHMMRDDFKGFMQVLYTVIGERPDPRLNSIGIADNQSYWLYQVQIDMLTTARERLQVRCSQLIG